MDISLAYIKMCEKAEELQPNVLPDLPFESNIFYKQNDVYFQHAYQSSYTSLEGKVKIVWLPRQDQLQEMVRKRSSTFDLTERFYQWLKSGSAESYVPASGQNGFSMEQLWLAFVMKEKCNKVWDGKEWTVYTIPQ